MDQCAGDTCAGTPSRQGSRALQQRTAIFAAVLALGPALGLANVGVANAQGIYFGIGPGVYDPGLPPHEIMRIVRSTGLTPLTRPGRRGPYYMVIAANRSGGQMRVVIDAYGGEIVRISPMMVAGLYGPPVGGPYEPPPPRIVTVPPELKDPPPVYGPNARFDGGVPPVPPRPVPSARIATAPAVVVPPATVPPAAAPPYTAALPARTPMPRARPSMASNQTPAAAPAALQATAPAPAPVPVPVPVPVPPAATAPVPPAAPANDNPAAKPAALQMIPVAPLE
jgi:hypothetical protein